MDKCFEIFKENELNYREKEEEMYKKVYYDFSKVSEKEYNIGDWSYQEAIFNLKSLIYGYNSHEIDKFFDILKKYNYDMRWEISDAIFNLGYQKNSTDMLKTINSWLNSPVIDYIGFDGDSKLEIGSDEYGTFPFMQASKYLDREDITDYIWENRTKNICHSHAYNIARVYPDWYTITSKISDRIIGTYYHSYTYDKENDIVIDLRSNCAMYMEIFERLHDTTCVSQILNSQLNKEIEITNKKIDLQEVKAKVLRVALYKEYLNSIGYIGPIEKGPSLRK